MSEVESEHTKNRLFLGNLPGKVSPHQLADALVDFREVSVAVFNSTGRSRSGTFAFVTFQTPEDTERGLEHLKDYKIGQKTISVERAQPGKRKEKLGEDEDTEKDTKDAKKTGKAANGTKTEKEPAAAATEPSSSGRAPRRKLPVSDDSIYISNIPLEVTDKELVELFEGYKDPKITVVTKEARKRRQGGKLVELAPKSYAFVKVGADAQDKAIEELNGKSWKGNELKVSKATVSPEELGGEGEGE